MRFWQKIFLCALALIMVSISLAGLMLLSNNHVSTIDQTRQNGIKTHDLMIGALQAALIHDRFQAGDDFLSETAMLGSLDNLATTYSQQLSASSPTLTLGSSIYLELVGDSKILYSNLPGNQGQADDLPAPENREELVLAHSSDRNTMIRTINRQQWLFVAGNIQLEGRGYTLVTVQNISEIYNQVRSQTGFFADTMLVLSMTAAFILLLIVYSLTRPIAVLRVYASRFARGEYEIRLDVKGHDELSELGRDINIMSEAVQKNIVSLEQMNEDRTRFIDNLGHEIKTPLTTIIGFSDLLRKAPQISDEERIRQADFIYREGRHLQHISRLLMELILLGRNEFDMEEVDLAVVLDETVHISELVMQKYQLALECESEHGPVLINQELFRSLISNLLDNAAKASVPGGLILLKGERLSDGSMQLEVQDHGCGIPPEAIEKIRRPFYVLDKARTRSAGGAGLGLALCDEIVRVHQGKMLIESKLGEGTTIVIRFAARNLS